MKLFLRGAGVAAVMLAGAAAAVNAQWSADPGTNLLVADGAGDQAQPKVRLIPGGGAYVSWLDGIGTGWDVRLQRFDADGVPQWGANGILVYDRNFSSTENYGLDVDTAGNAVLAFRAQPLGPVDIIATKIAPDGSFVWGATGVNLTSNADDKHAPQVVVASDGNPVIAWTNNFDVKIEKVAAADGGEIWNITEAAGTGNANAFSDIQPSDTGAVIVSFTHGGSSFLSPKYLWAQKYSTDGSAEWGGLSQTPVVVFDGASMPFGNFPSFVTDGAGGAVFGWYGSNNVSYVQHVIADGSEKFAHNGVEGSTNTLDIQVSPSVAYDQAADEIYLFWLEKNASTQDMFGVFGQRYSPAGVRQWGDSGRAVVPLDGTERSFVQCVLAPGGGGAEVYWFDKPSPPFGQRVLGARVDSNGDFAVWGDNPLLVCSVIADKARLDTTINPADGRALAVWGDGRSGVDQDVYIQDINADGTLGASSVCPCETDGDAAQVNVFDLLAYLSLWFPQNGMSGAGLSADFNNSGNVDVFDLLDFLSCWFPASAGNPCP